MIVQKKSKWDIKTKQLLGFVVGLFLLTGALVGASIGDGSTVDLFGGTQTIVSGDTTALATATIANPQANAAEVTVTANGGNCFDLVIAVTSHYRVFGDATSN